MDAKKKEAIKNCESFDELLDAEYGERGTEDRETFEAEAEAFCLAECLKEHRRLAGLTQEQLAAKIGTKKKDREWACGCTTLYALPYLCRTG